ncbi:MAG: tetratricopeptide repeat protein [Planctomycetota bacterium]|jgi:tetratricopeptide (TPR) repeat protein
MMSKNLTMSPKHPSMKVRNVSLMIVAAMVLCGIMAPPCAARRIADGDTLPPISAATLSGQQFDRAPGSDKAALITFLTADQKPSQQAAEDLKRVLTSFSDHRHQIDVVIVMDNPALQGSFEGMPADLKEAVYWVHDAEKQLWGQFHIIAAPTVIMADKTDKVVSVAAGYGYDFAPALRFHLNQALGIEQAMTADEVGTVKTVQNNTNSAKIQRHLKMAKMLQDKGKTDAALEQLAQARQLDPEDLQVVLEIGRLNCVSNKPDQALKALEGSVFTTPADKAAGELISGWAKRLSGDMPAAKEHLLKATNLDPSLARAFFELGQLYEATEQNDLALKAYKGALSILMKGQ